MSEIALPIDSADVPALCVAYLEGEESILAAAMPVLAEMKEGLHRARREPPIAMAERLADLANLLTCVQDRRSGLRDALASRLGMQHGTFNLEDVLRRLPAGERANLMPRAHRARRLANDVAAVCRWLAIHVRVHLDAYQRLLCDLTRSSATSGRYGAAGKAETGEWRPLIEIQG